MQILHKAEVAGDLPSDAKPLKTVSENRLPLKIEPASLRLEVFPNVAKDQENLEWEQRGQGNKEVLLPSLVI